MLYKCKFPSVLSAVSWGAGELRFPGSGAMQANGDERALGGIKSFGALLSLLWLKQP